MFKHITVSIYSTVTQFTKCRTFLTHELYIIPKVFSFVSFSAAQWVARMPSYKKKEISEK
jgi:hypothetical protein